MGLAVISGIIKGLTTPRDRGKKEDGEKTGKKEVPAAEKAEG